MREYMGAAVVANVVSMLRAEVGGAILLSDRNLEGKFFEGIVDSKARVVTAETMALDVLRSTKDRGVAGVVAVIEKNRIGDEGEGDGIFSFEKGDVFSLLISSDCLVKVINHVGGRTWVSAAERLVGDLLARCALISNLIDGLESDFNVSIDYSREQLVDWGDFIICFKEISKYFGREAADSIKGRLSEMAKLSRDELMCNGSAREISHILLSALRNFRPNGLCAERGISEDEFIRSLLLSFKPADLEGDRIYWSMRRWERLNPNYPIFPQWRELDSLQVVLDQRYWENDLRRMLEYYKDEDFSAIKLDLDNFKLVNEALGHAGGDEAIKLACRTVLRVVAHKGVVYRRGGDEIVVFAPGISSEGSINLCNDLRSAIESEFSRWGAERDLHVTPTASIGLAIFFAGSSAEVLIEKMDCAQMRAKKEGKNRVVVERCCGELI